MEFTSYDLKSLSYGDVIYGAFVVCLATCTTIGIIHTIVGTTRTTVGTIDHSILPFIIFCALTFVLSCSFFILQLKVPPSLTLFFFLRTLLGKFVVAFFLFSNVVCISSLVLLTLAGGFYGFSFCYTIKY